MGIYATLFTPPNGERSPLNIEAINLEDEEWFKANDVKISAEETGGHFVVYAGHAELGEEEAIEVSRGRDCFDTMAALRAQCQRMLEGVRK